MHERYGGQKQLEKSLLSKSLWISLSFGVEMSLNMNPRNHVPFYNSFVFTMGFIIQYFITSAHWAVPVHGHWSLIIADNLLFIVTGFEKGNFVNNDLSSSLLKSNRGKRWHALHMSNIHFDTIRVISVTWWMLVASASFCFYLFSDLAMSINAATNTF